jgi:PST family polysaccharide transporter
VNRLLARVPQRRFLGSVSSLYGLQLATLVLPLVLLPFLTRRLGADVWGVLAIQTSFSTLMIIVIEFGFGFGATRDAAAVRGDRAALGRIVSNLLGARVLLSMFVALIWVAVWLSVPAVREEPEAYWWTLGLTVAQGSSPAWFYQAIAKLPYIMLRELAARVASTVLIVLLVHKSSDAWLVPALQFATLALVLVMTISTMARNVDPQAPSLSGTWALLRANAHLCFTRLVQLFAPMGNTFLLGVISPVVAPSYGAAERTSLAARGLLSPVLQVAFPEIVVLYKENPQRARNAVRRILILLVGGAIVMSGMLWLLADLVVFILFGPEFASSVPVFRVLLVSIPLFAIIQVVGLQWLLPLKHDRAFLASAIVGVVLNVGFGLLLVPEYGAVGMASSLVLSELAVSIGLLLYTEFFGPRPLRIFRRWDSDVVAVATSDA